MLKLVDERAVDIKDSGVLLSAQDESVCTEWLTAEKSKHVRQMLVDSGDVCDSVFSELDNFGVSPVHYAATSTNTTLQDMLALGPRVFRELVKESRWARYWAAELFPSSVPQQQRRGAKGGRAGRGGAAQARAPAPPKMRLSSVNIQDDRGYAPLHFAAMMGSVSAINALLRSGANPNLRDQDGLTPLELASNRSARNAITNMTAAVDEACSGPSARGGLGGGLGGETKRPTGGTAGAVSLGGGGGGGTAGGNQAFGHSLQILLDNGVPVDQTSDTLARTGLHQATDRGKRDIVAYLLDSGAGVNSTDTNGWAALHYAAQHASTAHVSIGELLVDRGATVNKLSRRGRTALHVAATEPWRNHTHPSPSTRRGVGGRGGAGAGAGAGSGSPQHVRRIVGGPGAASPAGGGGGGHLSAATSSSMDKDHAVRGAAAAMISMLIQCGARIDEPDDRGCTPLHVAAASDSAGAVNTLLELGASFRKTTPQGASGLHLASEKGHWRTVQVYSKWDADFNCLINSRNKQGKRPSELAKCDKTRRAMGNLWLAAAAGDLEGTSHYLRIAARTASHGGGGGASVASSVEDATPFYRRTPLHLVALGGDPKGDHRRGTMAKLFIDNGATADCTDYARATPLMFAAQKGLAVMAAALIESGATVDLVDNTGNTALHYACAFKQTRVANLLEDAGADPTIANDMGDTCTDVAGMAKEIFSTRRTRTRRVQRREKPRRSRSYSGDDQDGDRKRGDDDDYDDDFKDDDDDGGGGDEGRGRRSRRRGRGGKRGTGSRLAAEALDDLRDSIDDEDEDGEDALGSSSEATRKSKKATVSLASIAREEHDLELPVGTKVEAKAKGFKQHYPGVVDDVADDGTYSVTFEDGDHKSGIKRGDIIIAATAGSKKATRSLAAVAGVVDGGGGGGGGGGGDTLAVGTKVEAKAKGFKQHYAGIVDAVAADGTYSVAFEDGDHKSGIPRGDIRGRPSTTKPKSKTVGSRLANLAATTT